MTTAGEIARAARAELVSTTGQIVERTVAEIVTRHRNIIGQGDGLLEDCPQSWRWNEEQR